MSDQPKMAPQRQLTQHVYHTATRSLCATCLRPVEAGIRSRDGRVWFRRVCPEHGSDEVEVCQDATWYFEALEFTGIVEEPEFVRPAERGCPFDCGPCTAHLQVWRTVTPRSGTEPERDCLITVRSDGTDQLFHRLVQLASGAQGCNALQVELQGLDVPAVVGLIVEASGDMLRRDDFLPSPVAHPHCVAVCPLVRVDGAIVPLARLIDRATLFAALEQGDGLTLGPSGLQAAAAAVAQDPSASHRDDHATRALAALSDFCALEDDERRRATGRSLSATIVAHALMDVARFDVGRAMRCPFGLGDNPLSTAPACVPAAWVTPYVQHLEP